MSDLSPPIEGDNEGVIDESAELQFDHAELATPVQAGPSCDACKRPISDVYHEINGKVLCTSCRRQIEASFRGGSGPGRFITAVFFGTGAAIVGALLYFAVVRVTGWNIGLVAILVGFMIGGAVRKGTGNRGGLLYQFLGVLLTYFAIGLMVLSFFVEHQFNAAGRNKDQGKAAPGQLPKDAANAVKEPRSPDVASNEGDGAKGPASPKPVPGTDAKAKALEAEKKTGPLAENDKAAGVLADEDTDREDRAAKWLLYAIFTVFYVCAGPVFFSVYDPLSGLIYCFALWQAWQMNKAAKLVFNGPFQVGKAASPAAGFGAPGDVG